MILRQRAFTVATLATLAALGFVACGDDESGGGGSPGDDAGADSSTAGGSGGSSAGMGGGAMGGSSAGTGGMGGGGMGGGSAGTGGMGGGGTGGGGASGGGAGGMDAGSDATMDAGPSCDFAVPDGGAAAHLRVVHASSTAPAVDIYAAGCLTPLAEDVDYTDATGYLALPPGTYAFDLRAAGAAATTTPAFTTPDVTVGDGESFTVVAAGDFGSTDAADQFRVLPLQDAPSSPSGGFAAVRVVHAAFDAPTVGIDVGNNNPSSPEIENLARFGDSGTPAVQLNSGSRQIGIAAGSATVTAFTANLPDRSDLLVIAVGELGLLPRADGAFSLLVVDPDSNTAVIKQNPIVYALHASPDAGAVDIFAGTTELVDNAMFGDMARLQVPPGDYTLDFFATEAGSTRPGGSPAVSDVVNGVAAGETYLAIATGEVAGGTNPFSVEAFVEGFALDDTSNARVRVVHSSPDAPTVDIGAVTTTGDIDSALIDNLSYPNATPAAGASLAPASLTLGVAADPGTATAAEFDVTLSAGARTFVVAAGKLTPGSLGDAGTEEGFQLIAIDTTVAPWVAVSVDPN